MSCTSAPSKPGPGGTEGTAAAKGAVPPEGWGREPDDRKAKAPVRTTQADGGLFASRWPCVLACKKHDSSAAEGGQPGGAPWWSPRIPRTACSAALSKQRRCGGCTGGGLRETDSAQVP